MPFFPRIRSAVALPVLLLSVLLLLHAPLFGQATGTVTGVVADATGAVIPNAVVVLTNQQNGTTRQTASNGAGYFVFASVTPGTQYVIKVTAPTFAPWQSQPFALRPGDQIPFSDIKLAVAATSTEVTVEAVGDAIKVMDSGERSDVITGDEIRSLSIVGRDATELVRILPGFAMSTGDQGLNNKPGYNAAVVGMSGPTGSFSANGTGTTGISITMDGATLNDINSNQGGVQEVNVDAIAEMKVTTSSYGAENAKGPTVISAITKSGTSSFHGTAYFHARDASLNSNDWYDNYLKQERPDGRFLFPGGTIGGPLLLPGTSFNKDRNKLFFFAQYEYYHQRYESGLLGAWVPTLSERKGDFSQASLNAELCGLRPDGLPNPNALLQMCYTENFLGDGTLVTNGDVRQYANPNGVALVNWLPLPNANPFANPSGYNYIQQVVQNQNGSVLNGKIDYSINDNNKIFLSYGRQSQIQEVPVNWGGWTPANSMLYPGQVTSGDLSNRWSLNYTRVFGPTMTNEVSTSLAYISQPGNMDNPEAVSRFYMNGYNCMDPVKRANGSCGTDGNGNYYLLGQFKNAGDYSIPALQNWGGNLGYPQMLMPGGFYNNQVRLKRIVPNISDVFSMVKGTHLLKTGIYVEKGYLNGLANNQVYPQGALGFDVGHSMWNSFVGQAASWQGCKSSDPAGQQRLGGAAYLGNCVNPIALMYMGQAETWQQASFAPVVNMTFNTFSAFVSDSWKTTRRLTLTLGARLEHMGPWKDRKGNGVAVFDPALYAQQCEGRTCPGTLTPGLTWHSTDPSIALAGVNLPGLYVSPRFGVAWDVFGTGDTVVRGGGGAYRSQEEFQPYALATSSATGYKNSYLSNQRSFEIIDSHSPGGPDVADFDVYVIDPKDTVRPLYWEYNLQISQRLPWHSRMELAYVGSSNRNLSSRNTSFSDLNRLDAGALFNVNLRGTGVPDNGASDIGNMTTAQIDFFRPYPLYAHIYQIQHKFYSNYNSFQASWNRSQGSIQYGVNYTFSKNLAVAPSYASTLPDPVNLANDYGPVSYDRTHVFNAHYMIDLGTRIRGNKLLGTVLNGWQLSGITTLQSGLPLDVQSGLNFGFGWGGILPTEVQYSNQVNPSMHQGCVDNYGIQSGLCVLNMSTMVWLGTPDLLLMPTVLCSPTSDLAKNQFVNPNCFGIPMPGQNGSLRMPYIHGPAYMNHDMTLTKNFQVGEKRNLKLQLAAFNFLNHALTSFNKNDTHNLTLGNFQQGVPGQALSLQNLSYQDFGRAKVKYGFRQMELTVRYEF